MLAPRPMLRLACWTTVFLAGLQLRAASPVVVQNEAGFEGLEEATVIYFPATNTFQNDPTNFPNHLDEGGGLFRDTLRNYYSTLGWWDGDRDTTNTDRQRTEAKGITGLGHQFVDQSFEYSFDFRTNPGFQGTGHFCDFFQLKALDGNNGAPLVAGALYKSNGVTYGRIDSDGDGKNGTVRTFNFTAGQWIHVVIRITPCASNESIGQVTASIDGDTFTGYTSAPIYLTDSTEYRPKFGFYRHMAVGEGEPEGDSWFEHRTVTGYIGSSNVLTWKGGLNANTWDNNSTQNFLNGATAAGFNINDQINFTDSTANNSVNISGSVAPNFVRVNSTQNYMFSGTGAISGGTLRKDGSGTLTLATTNSYAGLTDVRAGTLLVTGSIGNNSLVSITGGTLKAGSTTALGSNSTIGTEINGGTLDINGFNLTTEPISVQGAGASSAGAIVNSGAAQTSALTKVTLAGNTTLGGSSRWDIRGSGAMLSTVGNAYNVTKTGNNQVSLVGATVDSALGNLTINGGILSFQTSTTSMGDATKTVSIAQGATLGFFNTTAVMSKVCNVSGGAIWAESGTGSQNTFAGQINIGSAGGIFDAGSALAGGTPNSTAVLNLSGPITGSGPLAKNGPGSVFITSTGNTWSGSMNVNAGSLVLNGSLSGTVNVNSGGTVRGGGTANALVVKDGGTLAPGNTIGTLSANSLVLSSGALTQIAIGGTARGTQYDALAVTSGASLGGTLQVSLLNGFAPQLGQSFDILDWGSLSGTFASLQLPALSGGPLGWDTSHLYTTGNLSVVTNYLKGDWNRDGQVTTADIPAMLSALVDLNSYAATYSLSPDQLALIGDIDNSGTITNADLQGLLSLVAAGSGSISSVPEPNAVMLGVCALLMCPVMQRHSRRLGRRGPMSAAA